ncbi:MAG: ABC transporter substrate-binding protein, partial [Clostridiales bacterium]|nr:ABC transporter substrate-binding protein [Clostridiales bacterium]
MKKALTVLLALVLVFSLFSCAKTTEGGTSAPTSSAPTDTASAQPASAGPETAAPESAAPEKEYGGVLKIVNTSEGAAPLGIPWEIYSLDSYLIKPCGEGLVVSKADGEYVGLLATGWTADINEPSVTFQLRKGVKFTDGSDFNAEVVKWNCEKAQEDNMLDTNIISMEVIDDYTIKFGLEEWSFQILTSFERAMISKEAFEANGIEWARENPVMTGPFKLKQYDRGVKLVYERNENYWQEGKPYLDGVEYHFISDTMTQNAAMQATGDQRVDVLNTTSPEQVLALQGLDVYVLSMDSGSLNLIPNSLDPDSPFNDIRV